MVRDSSVPSQLSALYLTDSGALHGGCQHTACFDVRVIRAGVKRCRVDRNRRLRVLIIYSSPDQTCERTALEVFELYTPGPIIL